MRAAIFSRQMEKIKSSRVVIGYKKSVSTKKPKGSMPSRSKGKWEVCKWIQQSHNRKCLLCSLVGNRLLLCTKAPFSAIKSATLYHINQGAQ